jgi:hypothetical protein
MTRRNFDAEAVAMARGHRPFRSSTHGPLSGLPDTRPVDQLIVITANNDVLPILLAERVAIKPAGAEWLIDVRDRETLDRVVGMLKLRGIHGVLRRKRAR